MALPRLSLKRCFLYVVCITGMLLVVMNVRQKEIWHGIRPEQVQSAARTMSDTAKIRPPSSAPDARSAVMTMPKLSTRARQLRLALRKLPVEMSNTTGMPNSIESTIDISDPTKRPWYMKGGQRRPSPVLKSRRTGRRLARLWPDEDPIDDRVTNQLMFVPPDYNRSSLDIRFKKIYIPHGMNEAKSGPDLFFQQGCPVNTCMITRDNPNDADLILFKDYVTHIGRRSPNQVRRLFLPFPLYYPAAYKLLRLIYMWNGAAKVWMLYFLECPYHTQSVKNAIVNWTATYRRDSDIVAPYERWQYYDSRVTQIQQSFNYAANKTKKVAWFVSNCHPRNQRMHYAKELAKHIQVDIYGACGTLRCSRSQAQACFDMLDADYKFYLAFENSNCRDYITEKFFVNGLGHNVLPIVMGAHPTDYAHSAPYRSYIHVDEFESPRELAQYLHRLDADDELYNSYFKWKGTGEFINTYFWCRVCSMLHDDQRTAKHYRDVNEWWRGEGVCAANSWRELEHLRNT